ncbi:DegT/DnrJ/EryC1/StrS aminotransferase family protein [Bradyrhizobium sp. B097]|uniref:DegT/DnrJ/EryC1/StrS family aminotransferase n=1 Tax=Bradyrhizobium sp. B097 TaxID=3140244 RepID=UPI003184289F
MIPHSKPWIDAADIAAVVACLESGQIAEGAQSARLEEALAARLNSPRAIVVGSGSQALLLALRGVGAATGSEVILPTYVCPEVLAVVEDLGAVPVLVDIDEDYLVDFDQVAQACTARTGAIILPYLFGTPIELDRLRTLGIPLIADWAQYLPSRQSQPCCADVKILSFQATKVLAAGEGGAVLAEEPLAERIARLKTVDGSEHRKNLYPLSDLQAALARSQLDRLDIILKRRKEIADYYFAELRTLDSIRLPDSLKDKSTFYRYPVVLNESTEVDQLIEQFGRHEVAVRRPVDTMLHQFRPTSRTFPVAEGLFATTISLPIYPAMSDEDVETVVSVSRRILG